MARTEQDRTQNQNQPQNNTIELSRFNNAVSWLFAGFLIAFVTLMRPIAGSIAYAFFTFANALRNGVAFGIAGFAAYVYKPLMGFIVGSLVFIVNGVSKIVGLGFGTILVAWNLAIRGFGFAMALAGSALHILRPIFKVVLGIVYGSFAVALRVLAVSFTSLAVLLYPIPWLFLQVLGVVSALWVGFVYLIRPVLRIVIGLLSVAFNLVLKALALVIASIAQAANFFVAGLYVMLVLFAEYVLRPVLSLVLGVGAIVLKLLSLAFGVLNVLWNAFLSLVRIVRPLVVTLLTLGLSVVSKLLGVVVGAISVVGLLLAHALSFTLRFGWAALALVMHLSRPVIKILSGVLYAGLQSAAYVISYILRSFLGVAFTVLNLITVVVGATFGFVWGIVNGLIFGNGINGFVSGFDYVFKKFGGTTDIVESFFSGFNFFKGPKDSIRTAFDKGYEIIDGNDKGLLEDVDSAFNNENLIVKQNPFTAFMRVFNQFPSRFNLFKVYEAAQTETNTIFANHSFNPQAAFTSVIWGKVSVAQAFMKGWKVIGMSAASADPIGLITKSYNDAVIVKNGLDEETSWFSMVWSNMPGTGTSFVQAYENGQSVVSPNPPGANVWEDMEAAYRGFQGMPTLGTVAQSVYEFFVPKQSTVMDTAKSGYDLIPDATESVTQVFSRIFNSYAKKPLTESFTDGYSMIAQDESVWDSFVRGFKTKCTRQIMRETFKGINEHWTAGGEMHYMDQHVAEHAFSGFAGYDPNAQAASRCFNEDVTAIKRYMDLAVSGTYGFGMGCLLAIPLTAAYVVRGSTEGLWKGGLPGLVKGFFSGLAKGLTFPFRNTQREYQRVDQGINVEHHWYDLASHDWNRIVGHDILSWEIFPETYQQAQGQNAVRGSHAAMATGGLARGEEDVAAVDAVDPNANLPQGYRRGHSHRGQPGHDVASPDVRIR